jgi:ubiquinone/menaquinone biosynthesis C-methylase UbiE
MKPTTNIIDSPTAFRELIMTFQSSRIVLSAYELDVFSHIKSKGTSAAEVSRAIQTNPSATDRLMNALVAIGLLNKENGLFFNTPFAEKHLSRQSSAYLKGFHHTINMWDTWSTLTEVVRTGKTQRGMIKSARREDWAESFIGAMHERASLYAKEIIGMLPIDNLHSMLDIGGGSGAYSMEFVKLNAMNKATVFDLPEIISVSMKYIADAGLMNQFSFKSGNYNTHNFGEGYDFAFLSAIVHINSMDENYRLIKKCYDSLNKGGICAIQDHLMSPDLTQPYAGALFAINMLVGTYNGDTYTEEEISAWLTSAGFTDIRRYETFNNAMMIGWKK